MSLPSHAPATRKTLEFRVRWRRNFTDPFRAAPNNKDPVVVHPLCIPSVFFVSQNGLPLDYDDYKCGHTV